MIAYKGDKAPVVTQGGFVICEFEGDTAEVTQSVGKVLKGLGYRVELSAIGNDDEAQRRSHCRDSAALPRGAESSKFKYGG